MAAAGPARRLPKIGKYECVEYLGGGMSDVYRAWDPELERSVALKLLKEEACHDQDMRLRFLREAKLACRCVHENVVVTYDCGEFEGRLYLVMEYIEGQPLSAVIKQGQLRELDRVLAVARAVVGALAFVHSKGIIHRDIKPDNIYLDVSGRVKLIDFGIARTEDWHHTQTGVTVGTPYYMAPEQVSGGAITPRADIYAFGVLLYEMLTGARLIAGGSMSEICAAILYAPPDLEPLRQLRLPSGLIGLIERCLEKDPERRRLDFDTIGRELRSIAGGPTTDGDIGRKRRFRWKALAVVAIVAAMLIAVAVWAIYRATPGGPKVEPPKPQRVLQLATGDMLLVDEGEALVGKENTRIRVAGFYIDRAEVSNRAYAEFCRQTNRVLPRNFPAGLADHPVVNVTFSDASEFAAWAGKRLPTDQEWERAARGQDGRIYPWGNEHRPSAANVGTDKLASVGEYQQGSSPFGALQMLGNAWEWTSTRHQPDPDTMTKFLAFPGLACGPSRDEPWYAIRGGAYDLSAAEADVREYLREPGVFPARCSFSNIGFRCARDLDKQ